MRTNAEKVIKIAVQGKIQHPLLAEKFQITHEGKVDLVPSVGGIVYNVKVGDDVFGWAADHIEPGVSIKNDDKANNDNFSVFAAIGNKARVITGAAAGAEGYVLGKHGGVNHVIAQFSDSDLQKMAIDDQILVEAYGNGLKLLDYPDILVHTIDPGVFQALPIEEKEGKLVIPVAGVIPSYLIGSGVGDIFPRGHDCDLTAAEWDDIVAHGLDKLRFGDFVLIQDFDSSYGRQYKKGAATVGVIVHGDSIYPGHGPGITTFLTSQKPLIEAAIDPGANLLHYVDASFGKAGQ